MSLTRDVAPGVHRVEDAYTNWYIVEDGDELTVVDAGVPTSWDSLLEAVKALGRRLEDIRALVLTHAHFDHVGFAEKARQRLDIPVYAHRREVGADPSSDALRPRAAARRSTCSRSRRRCRSSRR